MTGLLGATLRRIPDPPGGRAAWTALAAGTAALIVFSSTQAFSERARGVSSGAGNLAHIPLFFALAWFTGRALRGARPRWAAILATTFGLANEIQQFFVPGRSASLLDLLVDAISAAAATAVLAGRRDRGILPLLLAAAGLALLGAWQRPDWDRALETLLGALAGRRPA